MRLRGDALAALRKSDALAAMQELEEQLEMLEDEDSIEGIHELIDGFMDGSFTAPVEAYDPADETAERMGEENPIWWHRLMDRERRAAGRKLAWRKT
jgi:hypothetical protein